MTRSGFGLLSEIFADTFGIRRVPDGAGTISIIGLHNLSKLRINLDDF
jgi:hypothetical protein